MNSSSLPALTLALGLCLGAGLGFLLGHESGPVSAAQKGSRESLISRSDSANAASSSIALGESEMAAVDGIAPVASSGPRGTSDLSGTELRTAERAASSAARIADEGTDGRDPSWTGLITGLIIDEKGAPVVGAAVMTYGRSQWNNSEVSASSTADVGRAFKGVKSLEGALEGFAKGELRRRKGFQQTVTDESGAFRLERLEPGMHQVQAFIEDYVIDTQNVRTEGAVQLLARKVGLLSLELTLPSGEAPEEAVVLTLDSDDDEDVLGKWTPAEPTLRTAKRSLRLRVISGTMRKVTYDQMAGEYSSKVEVIDLDRDGEGPHPVALAPVPQLHVEVKDESTLLPRKKPWVKVIAKDQKDTGTKRTSLRSRYDGPFIAADLEPGVYEVTVGRGSDVPEITEVATIGEGITNLQITLGDLDPADFAIVKVMDPNGDPIQGVDFRFSVKRENGSRSGGASKISRAGGEYWIALAEFTGDDSSSTVDGEITLTAKTEVYGSMKKPLVPGKGVLVFTFELPSHLTVVVQNAQPKMRVILEPAATNGDGQQIRHFYGNSGQGSTVDRDGRATVGQLQPGNYTLRLLPTAERWSSKPPVLTQEVTLKSGDQTITVAAPELHELLVHAPDLDVGTSMHLQTLDQGGGAQQAGHDELGDDHRVKFTGLAPGTYMLYAWGNSEQQQMEITVPSGEVLFEAMVVRSFEVTSVQKDKAAARAGLKKGDLVLGINEHEVKGQNFANRLYLTIADGPSKLKISRGGREMVLDVEKIPEGSNGWNAFGAQLTPRSTAR